MCWAGLLAAESYRMWTISSYSKLATPGHSAESRSYLLSVSKVTSRQLLLVICYYQVVLAGWIWPIQIPYAFQQSLKTLERQLITPGRHYYCRATIMPSVFLPLCTLRCREQPLLATLLTAEQGCPALIGLIRCLTNKVRHFVRPVSISVAWLKFAYLTPKLW